MATAREESGYGAGGKFRKRPFRRTTQATPYDRPNIAAAVRNSNNVNLHNNGWLSKLVDPAQRLIIWSAHRLFGSVFRKRLPPPPPSEPEGSHEAKETHHELISTDGPAVLGAINHHDGPSDGSDKGGLTDLEQILKQKTFTRSEIDRLTALLHSRTTDLPVADEQKRPEVIPSKPVVSHDRDEAFLNTPVKENGTGSQHNLTPVVVDEDVASPAELAKAYMGSRPSIVSSPMLGMQSQALREELTAPSNRPFPSAAPIMTLVPISSGRVGIPENGFVTPRSRGRSAIYNMTRTPYSRAHSTATLKGAGLAVDSFAGPSSSSQSTWEKNRLVEPKKGTLKRRSSVLDSDISSVGPIRRIRLKPNLLASKNLSLAPSGSPLSIDGSGVSNFGQHPLSSMQKPQLSSEQKHSFTKNSIPSASFTLVPSKSREMASKILQQLDKLVSREKSPTKLSPSMLRGPALKSLENVDSSIFLENIQDNNRLDGSAATSLPDAIDSTSQKRDKVEENGPTMLTSLFDKSVHSMNAVDATGIVKDDVPSPKTTESALTDSTANPHQQKKRGFLMSAHEDYLELDDDDYSNGAASTPLTEGRGMLDACVVEDKTTAAEAITVEKSPALSEVKPPSSLTNELSDAGTDDGPVAEKSSIFTFTTAPTSSMTVQPAVVTPPSMLTSNTVTLTNESTSAPVFSFGEKVASAEDSNVVPPSFGTSTTNADRVLHFATPSTTSVVSEFSAPKFGTSMDSKPESSNSFSSVHVDATDSVPKVPGTDKADYKNSKTGIDFRTRETALPSAASSSSSTASIFSVSSPANSSTLNNGSIASNTSSNFSPVPTPFSSIVNNQNTLSSSTVAFATSNCSASSTSTTSATVPFTAAPIFKFGSTAVPSTSASSTSASSTSAASVFQSTEAKTKDSGIGNSASMLFGGTTAFASSGSSASSGISSAVMGTGSSTFGGTASAITNTQSRNFGGPSPAIASTGSGIFGGTSSAILSSGSSIFGFSAGATSSAAANQAQVSNPFSAGSTQTSVNATGFAISTQSMPNQFASSSSSTFGLAGNLAFSSGSSLFGSSTSVAKSFGSAPTFGFSTSSSEANTISSNSGATTSVFGSGWQSQKTSTFNSTSPSTGFQFGASAGTSSAALFSSSTNASSSSIFPFTSAATAASSQPAFGNVNPVFAFGSTPSNNNNNDQMGMEDSMAEDTVQASTPTVPIFGQQPISPTPGFVFGPTTPSGANPFQFGGQQTPATLQNPSPFQASGSLDFNAGDSFSLGAGGVDKSQRKFVKLKHRQRKK